MPAGLSAALRIAAAVFLVATLRPFVPCVFAEMDRLPAAGSDGPRGLSASD